MKRIVEAKRKYTAAKHSRQTKVSMEKHSFIMHGNNSPATYNSNKRTEVREDSIKKKKK